MSYPVKFVKVVSPLAFAIALAACGGGPSFGEGGGNDGQVMVQTSAIQLSASTRLLPSDGSTPVVITAIAKDSNNNAIDDAEIIFSVDNNATIEKNADSTGSVVVANLTPGIPENRTLHVTARSGDQSQTIVVDVVGTTVVVDGPDAITRDKEVPFVLKLKDSANKPISFQTVELTSSAGNTIKSESNFETDAIGEIAFTVIGVTGGVDTITAKVLGVTVEKHIQVSGDEFVLTGSREEININTSETIRFVWKKDGVPQANKPITISATRGDIANPTVITDSAGVATFRISSTTAGQTVITATSPDGLSTSLSREFVATTPAYLNTQADPSLIMPNGSSTIVAKIRDVNDNPVKNKIIDFRLKDTVNGVLSASTAVTDSLGRASVSYTAGNSSSAKNGVEINTFIQGYSSVAQDSVFLTVGGDALRIVLGHDQLIGTDEVFYVKKFGVIVTDSAGNPLKDQKIDFTIIPTHYYKGFMRVVDTDGDGEGDKWAQYLTAAECVSEDFDNDGNLDAGEDLNNNGTLEPTHDATITNTGVTDEQGKIVIEVVYPKSRALWSKQIIAATTRVEGTEFAEYTELVLPLAAEDASDIEVGVPNSISPYGISNSCMDDNDTYSAPVTPKVVNAVTGMPVNALENDIWYTVRFTDSLGNMVANKTFSVSSSVATVETGPNNTFKLTDNNEAVDSSGFFITLTVDGDIIPLYYEDKPAVEPPTDTTPPVITLNGPATINMAVDPAGAPFIDPGANAVDSKDGPITVVKVGSVQTDVAGTYTIIYKATDNDGNTSEVIRTVIVQ